MNEFHTYYSVGEFVAAIESGQRRCALHRQNDIRHVDVLKIAKCIGESTTVKAINFEYSGITRDGTSAMATAIAKNKSLTFVRIVDSHVMDEDMVQYAAAIAKHPSLIDVRFTSNKITDVGAFVLADAVVRSATIRHVGMHDNEITETGLDRIEKALWAPYGVRRASRVLFAMVCCSTRNSVL